MQLFLTDMLNWVDQKDFNLDNYSIDSPIGSFLEIDLDYLEELHYLHNDYLLEDEKIRVRKEMLSEYQL